MTTTTRRFPCMELTDIKGEAVHVSELSSNYRVFLITLKSALCPVCPQLLHILNLYGLDPNMTTYTDPFTFKELKPLQHDKNFYRLLFEKDAYFIVVCPGLPEIVAKIQQQCHFNYPFVAGDQAMSLGKALRLNMSEQELWPAIVEVTEQGSNALPVSIGRSPGRYAYSSLLVSLTTLRYQREAHASQLIQEARDLIRSIKRKMIKCRDSKMTTLSLQLLPARPAPHVSTTPSFSHSPPPISFTPINEDHRAGLQYMPSEILNLIFSSVQEIVPLLEIARTSRQFYIAVCDSLISRLTKHADHLGNALTLSKDQLVQIGIRRVVEDWPFSDRPLITVGYRELNRRFTALDELVLDITKWTQHWRGRRRNITVGDVA
ncbi:hypothetical protein EC973_009332 [Apophysomyces ossiformis]|uniref:F-box domain-containing protein n=1 Tax=Apophysomyces ossiformis TaxID=679940 RepID=A0A8H7BYF4_9FUNG|nr:hypothetical protein EC973_009332 [Apophysomyces ossiformis]